LADVGLGASFEGKSSIFDTPEAQAIYFLLQAVADPKNEYAMRRCLAEIFYGVNDQTFSAINEQTHIFSSYLSTFENFHKRWLKAGVLAMIRDALNHLDVFDHWQSLARTQGNIEWERSLTNINQIAELLQQQSRIYKGHFALIRWLRDNISAASMADDDSKLRLESDEQLIRIITIHKSKGLEYPFVFIPFLFSGRGASEAWFYDNEGRLSIDLNKDDAYMNLADQERLAEDIRLLYVALTRAKYQCYIGTAAYKSSSKASLGLAKTAWAYLLFKGDLPRVLDEDILKSTLSSFEQSYQSIVTINHVNEVELSLFPTSTRKVIEPESSHTENLHAVTLKRQIYDAWRVQSFTGLMNEAHQRQGSHMVQTSFQRIASDSAAINIFNFPRGSKAGTFLHTLFESVVFETLEPIAQLKEQYQALEPMIHSKLSLSKLVDENVVSQWSHYLAAWMQLVMRYSLSPQSLDSSEAASSKPDICLGLLKDKDYFAEMTFYFSIEKLQSARFNSLLKTYGYDAPEVVFSTFEGHLKGAIDLVFKANDQYYILDYKSNFLGESVDDYQTEALQQAMDEHRYDVQYLIYTLAVHRFLKHRLGEAYCYERDFGGAYYLFLRGLTLDLSCKSALQSVSRNGVFFVKPQKRLIEALDKEVASI